MTSKFCIEVDLDNFYYKMMMTKMMNMMILMIKMIIAIYMLGTLNFREDIIKTSANPGLPFRLFGIAPWPKLKNSSCFSPPFFSSKAPV